jgi:hypothetical protein
MRHAFRRTQQGAHGAGRLRATRPRHAHLDAMRICLAALCVLAGAANASAQESHILVVAGVSGDEAHAKQFHAWATTLIEAAKTKDNVPDANIIYLAERPELDPARIRGRSTRELVTKAVSDIAAKARPGDQVVVVLIGHGSFDGTVGSFSLPGPDMTATEWGALLKKMSAQKVAFINTASSSGAFLAAVATPGLTVVTATKTGGERNEPKFGGFFVEAFGDTSADADRNGHVSVLEAFNFANNNVVKAYEQAGLLRTEHAAIEDGGGGQLAGTQFLTARPSDGGLRVDTSNPEMRALVADREAIQKEIDALRLRKEAAAIDPDRYATDLERLLTSLALKTRAIRELEATQKKAAKP